MNKCSPVDMRKNLELVKACMDHGIDFVAIPAKNEGHKNELIEQAKSVLSEMEVIADSEQL